ncbi:hypothetical protein BGZ47_008937, partial [Haplosporangium gracile]
AAPSSFPASASKKIYTEAVAASIASYQDKVSGTAPMVASYQKRSVVNARVDHNKVCIKAPVSIKLSNIKILSR